MELDGRRGDVLQIAENSAWSQKSENLSVQGPLAFVLYMMDRKAGYNGVKISQGRQLIFKIVVNGYNFRIIPKQGP